MRHGPSSARRSVMPDGVRALFGGEDALAQRTGETFEDWTWAGEAPRHE